MRSFNPEQFLEICKKNALMPKQRQTIGTLREKTLHAVLKQYYEPFSAMHEVKIGKYIADIINEDGVLEIQTGSFTSLQKKTGLFFDRYKCDHCMPGGPLQMACMGRTRNRRAGIQTKIAQNRSGF